MQNEGIEQIRCKEDEIEAKRQAAKAEADDRVHQAEVEAGLRIKQVEKALADKRRTAAAQVENETTAETDALLAQAKAEAGEVRQRAAANMDAAVALVVQAILCPM